MAGLTSVSIWLFAMLGERGRRAALIREAPARERATSRYDMDANGGEPRPGTMRMRPTEYPHILCNIDKDLPCVSGARLRVQDMVALDQMGETLDEIVLNFPPHTLAEICAALAYYYDHREEVDGIIEQHRRSIDEWRTEVEARQGPSRALELLRARAHTRSKDRWLKNATRDHPIHYRPRRQNDRRAVSPAADSPLRLACAW